MAFFIIVVVAILLAGAVVAIGLLVNHRKDKNKR